MAADDYTMGDLAQLSPDLLRQDAYTTPLSADDLEDYAKWKQQYAPHDSGYDYDLPGAYKAGLMPDAASGHFDDKFKKPNHPTFSTFSQYAKDRPDLAGTWNGDQYIPPADYSNVPGVGYVPTRPMGSLADMTGIPSWLERASAESDRAAAAYQQGGVPAMFGDTSEAQDLAGGFGGNIKGVGKGIKAYHGSPYDFEKFDISKIGTGEGAQSYGHGLYFAENPTVANDYRNRLGRTYQWNEPSEINSLLPKQYQGSMDSARRIISEVEKSPNPNDFLKEYDIHPSLVPAYQKAIDIVGGKGRMYEVNINADPGQFLQWDKPLSQQPKIAEALQRKGWTDRGGGQFVNPQVSELASESGQGLIRGLSDATASQRAASEYLNEAGIPGIRYLDQGSRGSNPAAQADLAKLHEAIKNYAPGSAEHATVAADIKAQQDFLNRQMTSNYVVFNPEIVDILKKYGLAGMLGTGAMGGLAAQDQYAP